MLGLISSYKCLFKTSLCPFRTNQQFSISTQSRLNSKIYNISSPQFKTLRGSTSEVVCEMHTTYYRKQHCVHRPRHFTSVTPTPSISLSHIKQTLDLHKFVVKDGFTCLQTKCAFCHETQHQTSKPAVSSEDNLFINKVTGTVLGQLYNASTKYQT